MESSLHQSYKPKQHICDIFGGGYARKSWEEMITSGIAAEKMLQKQSLAWIREQSMDENCVESLANHDPDIEPHVIEF